MAYQLEKNIRDNPKKRKSFDDLAQMTFGISFEKWNDNGYWTERYRPYTLFDGDKAVSNVSVNRMATRYRGKPRSYIQLGTVMTHPDYRGKGLARRLMEAVMEDWLPKSDGMYLFANESAMEFYPKFGFAPAPQFRCVIAANQETRAEEARPLNMACPVDRAVLKRCYEKGNPYSELPLLDNYGLLMFYCAQFYRESVYYMPGRDTAIILSSGDGAASCLDVYGAGGDELGCLLKGAFPGMGDEFPLGFTPVNQGNCRLERLAGEEDDLMVYSAGENLFSKSKLLFPALSHA